MSSLHPPWTSILILALFLLFLGSFFVFGRFWGRRVVITPSTLTINLVLTLFLGVFLLWVLLASVGGHHSTHFDHQSSIWYWRCFWILILVFFFFLMIFVVVPGPEQLRRVSRGLIGQHGSSYPFSSSGSAGWEDKSSLGFNR